MTPATLTKCNRAGCEVMTANTFCSRECNRLAHCGAGTRTDRLRKTCGVAGAAIASEVSPVGNCADWKTLRAYFKGEPPKDSSIARRLANIRKLRQEAEARRQKRRDAAKRRRSR